VHTNNNQYKHIVRLQRTYVKHTPIVRQAAARQLQIHTAIHYIIYKTTTHTHQTHTYLLCATGGSASNMNTYSNTLHSTQDYNTHTSSTHQSCDRLQCVKHEHIQQHIAVYTKLEHTHIKLTHTSRATGCSVSTTMLRACTDSPTSKRPSRVPR